MSSQYRRLEAVYTKDGTMDITKISALNIPQVMAATSLGRDAVYRAIRERRLIARKYGKRTLIFAEDLEKFLRSLPQLNEPAA
jgi:hypothetical protein